MTEQVHELDTLLPERELDIGQHKITLHEYTFMEGLRVDAIAGPVLDGLVGVFLDRGEDAGFAMSELSAVFGDHPDIMAELLAMATRMPRDWVEKLSDEHGQLLMMSWWAANKYFFVRRLVTEMAARQVRDADATSTGESVSPG